MLIFRFSEENVAPTTFDELDCDPPDLVLEGGDFVDPEGASSGIDPASSRRGSELYSYLLSADRTRILDSGR